MILLLETCFNVSKLKSSVIKIFFIYVSIARPVESSIVKITVLLESGDL